MTSYLIINFILLSGTDTMYADSTHTDSMHTDSMYTDSMSTDSVYTDSMYTKVFIYLFLFVFLNNIACNLICMAATNRVRVSSE